MIKSPVAQHYQQAHRPCYPANEHLQQVSHDDMIVSPVVQCVPLVTMMALSWLPIFGLARLGGIQIAGHAMVWCLGFALFATVWRTLSYALHHYQRAASTLKG